MDYKRLIMWLRNPMLKDMATRPYYMQEAADAIETLLVERDAAIEDIEHSCHRCIHFGKSQISGHCYNCWKVGSPEKYWQWRGPQKHD